MRLWRRTPGRAQPMERTFNNLPTHAKDSLKKQSTLDVLTAARNGAGRPPVGTPQAAAKPSGLMQLLGARCFFRPARPAASVSRGFTAARRLLRPLLHHSRP